MLLQEIREKVHFLVEESDGKILQAVKVMLETYNDADTMAEENIGEYNADIENAEAEYHSGDFFTHDEVVKLSNEWKNSKK